jgi:hypothetical protein
MYVALNPHQSGNRGRISLREQMPKTREAIEFQMRLVDIFPGFIVRHRRASWRCGCESDEFRAASLEFATDHVLTKCTRWHHPRLTYAAAFVFDAMQRWPGQICIQFARIIDCIFAHFFRPHSSEFRR